MQNIEVEKLNDKIIESAEPSTEAYFIVEKNRGFGVRIGARSKTFFVRRRLHGTTHRVSIGTFPQMLTEKARKTANAALVSMEQQIHPSEAKRQRVEVAQAQAELDRWTLAILYTEYLGSKRNEPLSENTINDFTRAKNRLAESRWWKMPIVKLQSDDIRGIYDYLLATTDAKRSKNGGKTTAAAVMRYVRVLINFGLNERLGGKFKSPFESLPIRQKWQQPAPKDNTILQSEHSLSDWWKAVEELRIKSDGRAKDGRAIADYLQLSLLFGSRRTELLTLTWDCVDFEGRTVLFRNTKNKKEHEIPLGKKSLEILTNAFKDRSKLPDTERSDYVFPASRTGRVTKTKTYIKEPKASINSVIEASNVEFTLHDLRRTFGTLLGEIGASFYQTKAALNHSAGSDVSQKHYIRIRLKTLRDIFERVEQTILEEAGIEPKQI